LPVSAGEATDDTSALRKEFASAALVLFKPWRELDDLLTRPSWWASFQECSEEKQLADSGRRVLKHMQEYYAAFFRPDDHSDAAEVRSEAAHSSDDEESEREMKHTMDEDDLAPAGPEEFDVSKADAVSHVEGFGALARTNFQFFGPQSSSSSVSSDDFKRALSGAEAEPEDANLGSVASTLAPQRPTTIIRLVHEAASDVRFGGFSPSGAPAMLSTFPTIGQVSRAFTLNGEQHAAFVLIASTVLRAITTNLPDTTESIDEARLLLTKLLESSSSVDEQMLLFMTGPAGTGKSRVLQACVEFAARWHVSDSLKLTASSGIASVIVRGQTYHSLLGINEKYPKMLARLAKGHPVDKEKRLLWSKVAILIIDECSMITSEELYVIDQVLRRLGNRNRAFGGFNVCFVGDLSQLPGSGGGSLFASSANSSAQAEGLKLWKLIRQAVELHVQVRQAKDAHWAQILNRMRFNQPTARDIQQINLRVISTRNAPPNGTIVAVPENKEREQLNSIAFRRFVDAKVAALPLSASANMARVSWRRVGAIRVLMDVREVKNRVCLESISLKKKKAILALPESDRNRLPYCLDLIVGGHVVVTNNVCVAKGVANGTDGTLVEVYLDESAVRWSNTAQCHVINASDVQGVVVQNHQPPFDAEAHYSPLPVGHFPLQCLDKKRSTDKYTINVNGRNVNLSAKLTQLPLVSMFALTGHKCQGRTLPALIVGPPKQRHASGSSGWLYVMLSRVAQLKDLYLVEPLDTNMSRYKRRDGLIREMQRIRRELVIPTMRRLRDLLDLPEEKGPSDHLSDNLFFVQLHVVCAEEPVENDDAKSSNDSSSNTRSDIIIV
jgi:hypothetical protein